MNNRDVGIFWGLRIELITSLGGVLGFSMLIHEQNSQHKNLPDEVTDWIEKNSSTVESWHKKLGDIRHSEIENLNAGQVCQRMIDVFQGVELVMNEANNLPESSSLEGKEKELIDGLTCTLQITNEYYNQMQELLHQ